jgi:hypothetical protein
MSDRPYMRHRIDELETFFVESTGDASVLQQLETELSFRQVPRAVTLLAKVRGARQGRMPESVAVQNTLFSGETKTATQPAAYSAPPSRSEVAPAKPEPAPTMSLLDAYKVLKVSMDSAWEVVENSRRQIVQRSRPTHLGRMTEEKRAPILREAMLANAAYAVILKSRTE